MHTHCCYGPVSKLTRSRGSSLSLKRTLTENTRQLPSREPVATVRESAAHDTELTAALWPAHRKKKKKKKESEIKAA